MPKEPSACSVRAPRKASSTTERRVRAARVQESGLEMSFRCQRCEEKNLRCFVDTVSGRCAGCISVAADCSLFVSEEDWEKVAREKREKRLVLARLEAATAQARVELLEVEDREMEYLRRDLKILEVQDRASEASGSST
ncbi:hypothetical protein CC86DRAFT_240186, partial [Ophiobolus disseminans]